MLLIAVHLSADILNFYVMFFLATKFHLDPSLHFAIRSPSPLIPVTISLSLSFLLRNSPEFQKLLGIAMELFLLCSDDAESDVRMVADECLNKVIKVRALWMCVPVIVLG